MRISLRKMDIVYLADAAEQRADSLAWLRENIQAHKTTDIHGALDILRGAEQMLRAIVSATDDHAETMPDDNASAASSPASDSAARSAAPGNGVGSARDGAVTR